MLAEAQPSSLDCDAGLLHPYVLDSCGGTFNLIGHIGVPSKDQLTTTITEGPKDNETRIFT